jgi:hypothetical protein
MTNDDTVNSSNTNTPIIGPPPSLINVQRQNKSATIEHPNAIPIHIRIIASGNVVVPGGVGSPSISEDDIFFTLHP